MTAVKGSSSARSGCTLEALVQKLAAFEPELEAGGHVSVSDVCQDSREVQPGALFVARRGTHSDGAGFLPAALERGASAVLTSHESVLGPHACPVLRVRDLTRALAVAAEFVHGQPSQALSVVGVTGTNGKTTTVWLVQQLLKALGLRAARIGTLGYELDGDTAPTRLTTPEADTLSRLLALTRARGASHVALEVSSVALSQRRADALSFRVAAFSNLTQDHLDFHGDLEAYGRAKARLFLELGPEAAVINVDDAFGRWLARHCPGRVISVGKSESADVSSAEVQSGAAGMGGSLRIAGAVYPLSSPLLGGHNVDNVALALGCLSALGVDMAEAVRALPGLPPAPGRLERVSGDGDDCSVLVDYAHTPDALERVLAALRAGLRGRVICVFGCGGDRDPSKREPMGRIAGKGANFCIATNDNPRSEPPDAILEAISRGLRAVGAAFEVCADRAEAIQRGVQRADAGDVVLIAGKGHENYQLVGSETLPFDDREQARSALEQRRKQRATLGRAATVEQRETPEPIVTKPLETARVEAEQAEQVETEQASATGVAAEAGATPPSEG